MWGIGLGGFAAVPAGRGYIIHSTHLWLLTEAGLVGFLLRIHFFVRAYLLSRTAWRAADDRTRFVGLAGVSCLGAWLGLMIGIEALYQRHYWFLCAAIGAMCLAFGIRMGPPARSLVELETMDATASHDSRGSTRRTLVLTAALCALAFLLPLLPETSQLPFFLCIIVLPVVGLLARVDRSVITGPVALFVGYLGLCTLSLIISPFGPSGASALALLVAHVCGMAAAHVAAHRKEHVTAVHRVSLVAAVAVSAYAIAQYYGLIASTPMLELEGRVSATFENPNHLGGYLACLLPVSALLVAEAGDRAVRWLWVGAGTVMYMALLFSGSRGAWWAFVIAGVCVGIVAVRLTPSLRWRNARTGLAVLLCAWTIATALYNLPTPVVVAGRTQLAERLTTTPELYAAEVQGLSSIGHRRLIWAVTRNMIADRPLSGLGYGSFGSAYPVYRERLLTDDSVHARLDAGMRTGDVRFAHNEYLQVLAESGIPAVVCLVAAVSWVLWSALRNRPPPELETTRLALLIIIVASLVHSLVSYPLRLPAQGFLFWFAIGALTRLFRSAR